MLGISPIKGQSYCFAAKLFRSGENVYRINPEISDGDFKVEYWDFSTDFTGYSTSSGAIESLTTTKPKVLNSNGSTVIIYLTAAQMAHDVVIVTAVDQDGLNNSWGPNCWIIYPDVRRAVLANKKAVEFVGAVAHLRVYAADSTTVLLDKILKDKDGNNLTALAAGQLATELAAT